MVAAPDTWLGIGNTIYTHRLPDVLALCADMGIETRLLPPVCDSTLQRHVRTCIDRCIQDYGRLLPPQFAAPVNTTRDPGLLWYYAFCFRADGREAPATMIKWYVDKVVICEYAIIMRGCPHPIEVRNNTVLPAYSFADFVRIFRQVYLAYGVGYRTAERYPFPALLPKIHRPTE